MPKATILALMVTALAACQLPIIQTPTDTPMVAVIQPPQQQPSAQSGTPQPVVVTGPCANTYYPVVKGATWNYFGNTSVEGDFARNETIVDVGQESFRLQWDVPDIVAVETWTCMPEGLRAEQALGGLVDAYLMGPDGNVNVLAVSNIGITLPPDIQPKDDWSQTLQIQAPSQDGALNGTITIDFEAIGVEEITVPAGTFNAMAINVEATATFSGGKGSSTLEYKGTDWFAAGVGRVLSIAEMSGPFSSSYQLQLISYNIPQN